MWGSLTGKDIIGKVKDLNEEKKEKEKASELKKKLKDKKITAFIRCEIKCNC